MIARVAVFLIALGTLAGVQPVNATPLNQWKISCGVDKGAIQKKGKIRVFTTSTNRCTGGVFKQRAEITSKTVSPNTKGKYLFTTMVSMTNAQNEKFDVFQMHDGRDGCAPPLKVTVLTNNRIKLEADYKTGPGESCVRDVFRQSASGASFKRDGSEQRLDVMVEFLGQSAFNVVVALDGKLAAQGSYSPPSGSGYFQSKHYYFKHGVYSLNMFDYRLVSRGMKVKKLRN